jgi:hypothetical protein
MAHFLFAASALLNRPFLDWFLRHQLFLLDFVDINLALPADPDPFRNK